MYELQRTSDARASERTMPESLRGVTLVTIHDDTDPPHVLIERIVY